VRALTPFTPTLRLASGEGLLWRLLSHLLLNHLSLVDASGAEALREMLRLKDRTVFLDVRTDPGENVWPMVQAGKGITEMLLGSEDL